MRVLFATTLIPSGESSGGELVSSAVMQALEQLGGRVTVMGFLRPGDQTPVGREAVVVDRRPIETADSGLRAAGWLIGSALSCLPYTSAKFFSRSYGPLLREIVERKCIDTVIIDHTQMLWLLDWVPKQVRVLTLMHNAESELYACGALGARSLAMRLVYRREAKRLRDVEANAVSRVGRVWVLSEADAEIIRSRAVSAAVSVLPVMPAWSVEPARKKPSFDVALLATWSWRPNAEALQWFLAHVHPRLPQGTSVHIAGRGAEWASGCHGNLIYRGFVEDAVAFLKAAKVIAVPTRYGSGLETKMLAAIATGRAIVASSASTRGLGKLPGSIAVADEAAEFSRHIGDKLTGRSSAVADGAEAVAWCAARRRNFLTMMGREFGAPGPNAGRVSLPTATEIWRSASNGAV